MIIGNCTRCKKPLSKKQLTFIESDPDMMEYVPNGIVTGTKCEKCQKETLHISRLSQ